MRKEAKQNNESAKPAIFRPYSELYAEGKRLRDKCPRTSHAEWKLPKNRPDPLFLLEESSKGRMPELIPIRYGRMLRSPFTFYRGAALNMAADLSVTPVSGLRVQACGDAHLCNFGVYATPERRVIFDINDLDETLPAPWEWDVKRLTASFVLASRNNGFRADVTRDIVLACLRSYREGMSEFSQMRALDVWYASTEVEELIAATRDKEAKQRAQKRLEKTRATTVLENIYPELVSAEGATPRIKDSPPLIFHAAIHKKKSFIEGLPKAFASYRESLPEYRRILLDRFELLDVAIKVVGIGSVGTACSVMLLMANEKDPLFLQVKEARASVLEPYAGKSKYPNHGQRVVTGCQLMQSASDLFLGWTIGPSGRHLYVRQLKDMKANPMVEIFTPSVMEQYAEYCGRTLARAHARSGEPVQIVGYLGKSDTFDQAVADFSFAYADQGERDHDSLMKAVRAGKIEVDTAA
ncbi:MAG: DUF2252 domain-containing protein [Acidobacteria bacterium]|nr:MAG: DUF2252 domain-containing protein [Acidobacteriota bacterium]